MSHLPRSLSEAWHPDGIGWQVEMDLDGLDLPASGREVPSIASAHSFIGAPGDRGESKQQSDS